MKKIITLVFAIICLCSTSVYAGETSIESINVIANVLENGDMDVTETIVYDITGSLNGVYRDILLSSKDKYGASDLNVQSVKVDGQSFTYWPDTLQNGENGKYNFNSITDGRQIKIFVPTTDSKRTVEIKYTLKDVVLVYEDIAELHWDFIGSEWENGIGYVNIVINLPGESDNLRAWGHGPLDGTIILNSKSKVTLTIDGVNSNTEVTARVAFDKNLITTSAKTYNRNGLENILKEEEEYAAYANNLRKISKYLTYALIANVFLIIICPIAWYLGKKKEFEKADFDGKYYRELPEDYGPAVMCELLGTKAYAEIMPATLMNMSRLGYVSITEIKNEKKTDYNIKLVKDKAEIDQATDLANNEKYFALNMLFDESTEFTLEDMKKRFKKSSEQSSAVLKHQTWLKKIEEDAHKYNLYKKDYKMAKGCVWFILLPILLSVVLLVLGFIFNFEDIIGFSMIILIFGICGIAMAGVSIHSKIRLTKKGVTQKEKWKAFSKFLDDFSKMEDYPVQSLVLWEHFLVYAVALGKAKTVIKQLKVMYPTELTDNNVDLLNTYTVLYFCRNDEVFSNFDKTFNSALSTAFTPQSSGSGTGGGFSGGGGSGGGGGGGGRFLKLLKYIKKI